MRLFGSRRAKLSRVQSLGAYPVVNQLVKFEELEGGEIVLHVPRKQTGMARAVIRAFKLPSHRQIALDRLGSFVIKRCDGECTVKDIVSAFRREFHVSQREAEVSIVQYLKMLAQRSIIGLAVPTEPDTQAGTGEESASCEDASRRGDGSWKQRKRRARRGRK